MNYFKYILYVVRIRLMNRLKLFFIVIIFLGISGNVSDSYLICSTDKLYVGTARLNITPPVGIKMAGYSSRNASRGIHDPLYIKVLVLEVGGYRTAIISCDLIWYYDRAVLDVAREKFNIPHTLVCFSHTHSGPNLRDSENYTRSVGKAMIDGIDIALKNMYPARISAGYKSFPQLGYNRLANKGDKIAQWRDYERIPYGPVDSEVGVIKIEDEDAVFLFVHSFPKKLVGEKAFSSSSVAKKEGETVCRHTTT